MSNMTLIEQHYNKFNEDKRLLSRHGRVEHFVTENYIHRYIDRVKSEFQLKSNDEVNILDIGAGTGAYCVPLAEEGYSVSAIELVKHNLGILKTKTSLVKARQGNAMNLKKYETASFHISLLFGPMYHLFTEEDKLKALSEAVRVTKPGGYILVAYVMNEYAVVTYCFKEKNIKKIIEEGRLTNDFHTISKEENLYDYMRLEDIDRLNSQCSVTRDLIISPDGAADYMRPYLNQLDEEEFNYFLKYQLSICERRELLGAGAHTVDILKVTK